MVAGRAHGQMPSRRKEECPGCTGFHPHLPPSHRPVMAQHPPSRQVSELPFAPHLGTSESLRHIQRARAGRRGKAGAPSFSVQSATEKRLSGLSLWLVKGQHGPGCEHMYLPRSPTRQRRVSLPEELVSTPMQPSASTSTPNATRQHTASSGKAVISRSLSALHSHQQGGKHSALDEPKDNSSCLLQLLTP